MPAFLSGFAPQQIEQAERGPAQDERPSVALEAVMSLVQRTAGGAVDADAEANAAKVEARKAKREEHWKKVEAERVEKEERIRQEQLAKQDAARSRANGPAWSLAPAAFPVVPLGVEVFVDEAAATFDLMWSFGADEACGGIVWLYPDVDPRKNAITALEAVQAAALRVKIRAEMSAEVRAGIMLKTTSHLERSAALSSQSVKPSFGCVMTTRPLRSIYPKHSFKL